MKKQVYLILMSQFYFLICICIFMTHITLFCGFTKMSQLEDLKHGFTPI
jgi:hypothetical protein